MIRQVAKLKQGLEKPDANSLLIKDSKLKVQAQIQDEQVRVTGKKIDDEESSYRHLSQRFKVTIAL